MNLFSVHLSDDVTPAVLQFVQDLLLEIAAQPGVDLVAYEGAIVPAPEADLPAAPSLENGE